MPDRSPEARHVVAALDSSMSTRPVVSTARAIAELIGADSLPVHVAENGASTRRVRELAGDGVRELRGEPAHALCELAARRDVIALVLGARRVPDGAIPVGHIAEYVLTHASKPVVVVPPDALLFERIRRVVLPLEDTPATVEAHQPLLRLFERRAELVLVHVFDVEHVPPFEDHAGHETEAWIEEFMRRACRHDVADLRVELRTGQPAQQVLEATESCAPDLVAVSWSQDLRRERAAVVKMLLSRSRRPVLLLPAVLSLEALELTDPVDVRLEVDERSRASTEPPE